MSLYHNSEGPIKNKLFTLYWMHYWIYTPWPLKRQMIKHMQMQTNLGWSLSNWVEKFNEYRCFHVGLMNESLHKKENGVNLYGWVSRGSNAKEHWSCSGLLQHFMLDFPLFHTHSSFINLSPLSFQRMPLRSCQAWNDQTDTESFIITASDRLNVNCSLPAAPLHRHAGSVYVTPEHLGPPADQHLPRKSRSSVIIDREAPHFTTQPVTSS